MKRHLVDQLVVFWIDAGKDVQVADCRHQRPASSLQRLIDLGDALTHPGMLSAKIRSGPGVPWALPRRM